MPFQFDMETFCIQKKEVPFSRRKGHKFNRFEDFTERGS